MNAADVPDDAEIVREILDGNPERFEVLVHRYRRRLVAVLYRQVGDHEEAQDIAQEVFVKVYGALDRFDPAYRFSTWLFRIAGNAAIDHLRRRRIRTISLDRVDGDGEEDGPAFDPASGDKNPEQQLRSQELGRRLDEAIARLPEDYRDLIALRHFGEMAYEEIAEMKGMPLGTVKNKLFRARMILREQFKDDLGPV